MDLPILLLQPLAAPASAWREALLAATPDIGVRIWPDIDEYDRRRVEYAAVMRLPKGELATFPNLKLICSLLAGQDGLLSDPDLPFVPIVRTDGASGSKSMNETVVMHVLRHFRQLPLYAVQQAAAEWRRIDNKPANETCVVVLGLGLLGLPAALAIHALGFKVLGWTRTEHQDREFPVLAGPIGLDSVLQQADILVNLLPLTPATAGILGRGNLAKLRPGASLINLGRGAHLPAEDLYWAIDEGILAFATLDVFETEPPAPGERVWSDPRITLTPHVARTSFDLLEAVGCIAAAVRAIRAGQIPRSLVDRSAGY